METMNKQSIEKIEHMIRSNMRKANTPGLAISILKNNEIVYEKGFGSRDLKEFKPMTPNTLIGIGSVTKSFTALAIMILQERNQISLEDSASKYLNFKPFSNHPEIKIKHMLSHSSGVPAADAGMPVFNYNFDDFSKVFPATTKDDFIAHIGEPDEYIVFKPGEAFFYNNDMYTCVAFIIEQLTGMRYRDFVKKEIFEPLEMKRATFNRKDLLEDNDHMTGYHPTKDGDKTIMKKYDVPIEGFVESAGGIYVSMNEMMNYAQLLLNKGSFKGRQLLKPESIETLFKSQIKSPYGFGKEAVYCLGWVVDNNYFNANTLIHHGGGMATSCSFFGLIPELNMAVSIAQNSCTGPFSIYGRIAFALELGQDPEKTIKYFENVKILEEISGNYKSPLNLYQFSVNVKGGVVYSDFEIDDGKFSFPLLLIDRKELKFRICNSLAEKESFVTFYRNKETKKVDFLNYDRYLYKKI